MSTPIWSFLGKVMPQSMTTIRPSLSTTYMFLPISPAPPSGITRTRAPVASVAISASWVLVNRAAGQARERMPRRSSTVRRMSRWTGVASTSGSRSRAEGISPVISRAALMRMGLVVTKRAA